MTQIVRIAAAQTPEFRNDIPAALSYAVDVFRDAERQKAKLLCFPEGYLQGYLLDAHEAHAIALDLNASEFTKVLDAFPVSDMTVVMGVIEQVNGKLYNTAVLVQNRMVIGRYRKAHLLRREGFFEAGTDPVVASVGGLTFGVNICCDTNFPEAARKVAALGGSLIVCPANNMLPFARAMEFRDVHNMARGERCKENSVWLISADVTGVRGNNVGLGPTAVLDPSGHVVAQLSLGQPGLLTYDLPIATTKIAGCH